VGDNDADGSDGLIGGDEANDVFDDKPPPGPSPREVRRRWVEEGNVGAFLDLFHQKPWSLFSINEQLRNLHRACEVRALKDPVAFSGEMFARMVAFSAFLVLRTQLVVAERVVGRGELPSTPTIGDLSNDVAERLLPRLAEMQRGLAEVLVAQAQCARLAALTRAKEAQTARAAVTDHEPPRRPRSGGGKKGRTGSRVANAKDGSPRDGAAPLPAQGRRRGGPPDHPRRPGA
jgi:hypothetical protein